MAPSLPFVRHLDISAGIATGGPGFGTFAVSSLTLANLDAANRQVRIFKPVLASGSVNCPGPITGEADPIFVLIVPAGATLHIPYPTPLVFASAGSLLPCIGAQVLTANTRLVYVDVNGFVN